MNIKLLWDLAKTYPALARLINLAILSFMVTLVTMIINYIQTWQAIDINTLLVSILLPFFWYFDKKFRDLKTSLE